MALVKAPYPSPTQPNPPTRMKEKKQFFDKQAVENPPSTTSTRKPFQYLFEPLEYNLTEIGSLNPEFELQLRTVNVIARSAFSSYHQNRPAYTLIALLLLKHVWSSELQMPYSTSRFYGLLHCVHTNRPLASHSLPFANYLDHIWRSPQDCSCAHNCC